MIMISIHGVTLLTHIQLYLSQYNKMENKWRVLNIAVHPELVFVKKNGNF